MNHTAAMLRGMGTDEALVGYMLSALIELADQLDVMYTPVRTPCCQTAKENRRRMYNWMLKATFEENT